MSRFDTWGTYAKEAYEDILPTRCEGQKKKLLCMHNTSSHATCPQFAILCTVLVWRVLSVL